MNFKTSRKGQAWYADFMIGLTLFLSVIGIYYTFQSAFSEDTTGVEDLIADAKQISNMLVSPGYPDSWTAVDVQRIGLTNNTPRIVVSKVEQFGLMNYSTTRNRFRTGYNYVVYFREGDENITLPNNQTFIGREPVNATDLVTALRFVIYDSRIAQMEVQVWR